jgi:hypothetical protein
MARGLLRRNGRYSVRRRIPVDLQPLYGRAEIVKSLDTADPKEARERGARAWVAFDQEFTAARASMRPAGQQPVDSKAPPPPKDEASRIGAPTDGLASRGPKTLSTRQRTSGK